jgi:hypothetical protein
VINRKMVALLVGATLAFGTAGCPNRSQDTVTGTVKSKEYEPRNCERRSKGKCKRWDPAEHELTIVDSDGDEVELVVTKQVYNNTVLGATGTWRGRID